MHKLKNKHTGEVITTPYMAEVEEYLNGGDYEMKKPVYTKEIHERGEKPTIGDKVKYPSGEGVIVVNKPDESGVIIVLDSHCNEYKRVSLTGIEPIPTIEDELVDFITNRVWNRKELAVALLEKFNITPKDS